MGGFSHKQNDKGHGCCDLCLVPDLASHTIRPLRCSKSLSPAVDVKIVGVAQEKLLEGPGSSSMSAPGRRCAECDCCSCGMQCHNMQCLRCRLFQDFYAETALRGALDDIRPTKSFFGFHPHGSLGFYACALQTIDLSRGA